MTFTDPERDYLADQPLGRIGTADVNGEPDVATVGFSLDGDDIVIGGMDITKTLKHRNVLQSGRASFVVDDLLSRVPWRPRGVKVTGPARIDTDRGGRAVIRLTPETIWSWGLNLNAEKRFGAIEKRTATPPAGRSS
jgi:pyridoxamine 5'-phosphate oxidase family protein